jgi:hypothetical protein
MLMKHFKEGGSSSLSVSELQSEEGESLNGESPTPTPSTIPSAVPSDVPSTSPSFRPTLRPSSSPSASPTNQPSSPPSAAPTRAPTRPKISPDHSFRLKLYWNNYFWQEEDFDREWCLECASCESITASDKGEGCTSSGKGNEFKCRLGDQLWVQKCGGKEGNTVFQVVQGDGGWDQIKVKGTDLCMERNDAKFIVLAACEIGKERQQWLGFQRDKPFDLRPVQRPDYCVTQHHHPKASEIVSAGPLPHRNAT